MSTCIHNDIARVYAYTHAPERAVVHDRVELVGQPQGVRPSQAVAELGPLGVKAKEEGAGGGAGRDTSCMLDRARKNTILEYLIGCCCLHLLTHGRVPVEVVLAPAPDILPVDVHVVLPGNRKFENCVGFYLRMCHRLPVRPGVLVVGA